MTKVGWELLYAYESSRPSAEKLLGRTLPGYMGWWFVLERDRDKSGRLFVVPLWYVPSNLDYQEKRMKLTRRYY